MAVISGRRPGAGTWRMVAALVRQRRRLALATVAIALGVGYLAGALTLLDRVSAGLDDLVAAGSEEADLVVEGTVAYESALEQTRRLVPAVLTDTLREVPGVAAVSPRVEEITMLLGPDGTPVVAPGLSEQPLGTNWPEDEQMSPYRFVGDGRPPEDGEEVVIDESSAEAADVQVGDTITVAGRTKVDSYEVVGIVNTAAGRLPSGASLALFTTDEARDLFDAQENDNRIAIRLEDGADVEEMRQVIQGLLPNGAEVVDGATAAEHRQENLTRSFALVRVLIMGFAGLALVVGMITVSNSLTLLYAERRRTLAAFRLVGAKPRQLMGAALIEAAMLAGIASLIGAPLGLLLGRLIEAVIGALGTSVPVGGPTFSFSALLTAVLVGAAATVLAAVMPARRACRVAPVEAVMESPREPVGTAGQRIVDASVVALGVGIAVAGLLVLFDVDTRIAVLSGGAATVLLVLAAVLPWALSSAVAAGIRLVPLRPPTLRRIAARDAVRNRSRTAATTGALMLATAVVAGLAVFLSSFAASLDGDVDELVTADLVIDSGTFTRGGLPAELLDQANELSSVESVSGWQVGRVNVGSLPARITAIDGDALGGVLSPGWVGAASPTEMGENSILLEAGLAERLSVQVGDRVPVYFTSDGVETLIVEGIYSRGSVLLGEAVIDRSTLLRQVPASFDIAALVQVRGDAAAARAEVEDVARSFGVTAVVAPDEFVDRRSDLLHGFERVIQWMLFFTLIQALVGVINTLLLSVGERRREFGLLRAAGAGPRHLRRLVLAEGLSFAVVGTLLGLVLGIAGGVAGIRALERYGISGVAVPVVVLLVTAFAAVALGVAASVVPARWAASVPPLEAVSDAGVSAVRPRTARRWGRRGARPDGAPIPAPAFPSPAAVAPAAGVAWPAAAGASSASSSARAAAPGRPPWARSGATGPLFGAPSGEPAATAEPPTPAAPPAPAAPAPPASPGRSTGPLFPTAAPIPPASPADHPSPAVAPPRPAVAPQAPLSPTEVAARQQAESAPRVDPQPGHEARPQSRPETQPASQPQPQPQPDEPERSWVRPATESGPTAGPAADERPPLFAASPRRAPQAPPAQDAGRPAPFGPGRPQPSALDPAASIRLAEPLERLDPASVRDALPALVPLARTLDPDEQVLAMVQGWAKGLLGVVARTERRLVVVVDRFPEPLIESLDPVATRVHLFGPPGTDRLSVAIVDGNRLLELSGVRDAGEAEQLAAVPQPSDTEHAPEYF